MLCTVIHILKRWNVYMSFNPYLNPDTRSFRSLDFGFYAFQELLNYMQLNLLVTFLHYIAL